MSSQHDTPPPAATDAANACVGDATQALDDLLNQLHDLAKSETDQRTFYTAALQRAAAAVGGTAGAAWQVVTGSDVELLAEFRHPGVTTDDRLLARPDHQQLLRQVGRTDAPQVIPPGPSAGDDETANNALNEHLLAAPVHRNGQATAVIEVLVAQPPRGDDWTGHQRFMAAVVEIAEDFERNRRLRDLENRDGDRQQFEQFVSRLHEGLDLKQTAECIANDGRCFVGCDRLSVAAVRKSRCEVAAISGIDKVDRRAPAVRLLESLIERVTALGQPFWSDRATDDAPPEITEALETYRDESHVRVIGILPLCRDNRQSRHARDDPDSPDRRDRGDAGPQGEFVGALAFEQFTQPFDVGRRGDTQRLGQQARVAVQNALEYESLPLRRLSLALRWAGAVVFGSRWRRTAAIASAILVIVLLLVLVKTDLTIAARGTIQPRHRRHVFAPGDGVVESVSAGHGQQVEAGKPLLVIRDQQLEWERERVVGELQTARQRLSAIKAERIDAASSSEEEQPRRHRITSEEEELKEVISGLQKQLVVLDKRRDELTVCSPIDGEVITWNVRQLLEARPVSRGQLLMDVADPAGPWVLELEVPQEDVAHVSSARSQADRPLRVDVVLASHPGHVRSGKLESMARSALTREDNSRSVSARAEISVDPQEVTPGATAVAKIYCGRRSVGYVWFRDVITAICSLWTP